MYNKPVIYMYTYLQIIHLTKCTICLRLVGPYVLSH